MSRTRLVLFASILASAVLAAGCASDDATLSGSRSIALARVESVRQDEPPVPASWFDGFGPLARLLSRSVFAAVTRSEVSVLTQTGETVLLALDRRAVESLLPGDCVGIVARDASAGLRATYSPGEALLTRGTGCDEGAK